MSTDLIDQVWEKEGFELVATGGGFWAAQKAVSGVLFKICDYNQTRHPDPAKALEVSAYVAESHEWLEFTQDVESLQAALALLPEWAAGFQKRICA
ncbi:hypothetical protein [Pseudomonas sp. UMAB-40]|uniref:hypothetical protein n=1 Tax=Pseudomonas sp. UMAB-40 TaxID=1365407 RepID=UPI001C59BCB2|nr:hypothetical protein [Pseudomonas sp. UMAB-40]